MKKYRHPKIEEFEKYCNEGFLKAVDNLLQLFPPKGNCR